MQKVDNYIHALSQLEEAVKAYTASPEDGLYRDGLIQRFEFTVELAWKSLKEYLEDQGAVVLAVASPRAILKEAYAAGFIDNPDGWNAILTARNITSHVYDEKTAEEISDRIVKEFLPVLQMLRAFYQA